MEETRNAHTVVRTRLTQALIVLMAEKPYDAISVTEIAVGVQAAHVSS